MSEELPPPGDRLQKVLARAGLGSRRQMEIWIEEGRVTINGHVATLGERADLDRDAVKVDGRRVPPPSTIHKYILLNKPPHHVSTLNDPEGRPTIMDLIPHRLQSGLVPVGRLDYDSEGMILLTDDGELAHRVAHPRYGCTKTYEVKVKGRPSPEILSRFQEGMMLYGRPTAPVTVAPHRLNKPSRESQSNSWWRLTLGEGRTRQIREMFFRLGHPVARLRRVAIGNIKDPQLPPGSWRFLTEQEVEALRERTAKAVAPVKPTRRSRRRSSGVGPRRRRGTEGPPRSRAGGPPGEHASDPTTSRRSDSNSSSERRPPNRGGESPARNRGPGSDRGQRGPDSRGPGADRGRRGPGEGRGGDAGGRGPSGDGSSSRRGPSSRGPSSRGPSSRGPSSGGSSSRRGPGSRGPSSGGSSSRRGPGSRGPGGRGPGSGGSSRPGGRGPGSRGPGGRGGGRPGGRGPGGRGGGGGRR